MLTEISHAQPSVPILQQALQHVMFIQNPTLQGSRAEYLKVRVKGNWEGKGRKAEKENSGEYTAFPNYHLKKKQNRKERTCSLHFEDSDCPNILRKET